MAQRRAGSAGGSISRVYATELNPRRLEAIRETATSAAVDVTIVEAGTRDTNLPPGAATPPSCDACITHPGDAAAINASLYDAVKPGGRLAIIEIEPTGLFIPLRVWPHWTDDAEVVSEVTAAGFTHLRTDGWPSLGHYVAMFEKR